MKSCYIHIPFCNNICTYCDFSKMFYNTKIVDKYLIALENEIKYNYKSEKLSTLYIGGGTPSSLSISQLENLFNILKIIKLNKVFEFTIECNPEDLTLEKIKLFKMNNINRVSIGVQTFNENHLKFLGRKHNYEIVKSAVKLLKENGIKNINIDMMYGFENQTIKHLKEDLFKLDKLNINHVSYYSLIIEPNTKLYINNISFLDDDIQLEMNEKIISFLEEKKFYHYEISNFAKMGYESKHNLTYWNNENYYGFGLSSHYFINDVRSENTRNIFDYIDRKYLLNSNKLTKLENMQNEMILNLRKLEGINKERFQKKFNKNIEEVFDLSKLEFKDGFYKINKDKIFISNEILRDFI
ncbi:MAG: radical SAM family heme chaperone HemW [Bacilli bacterium]